MELGPGALESQAEDEIIALKSQLSEVRQEAMASRSELKQAQDKLKNLSHVEGEKALRAEGEIATLKAALLELERVGTPFTHFTDDCSV